MNNVDNGFDVVIICTTTATQAQYWEERLTSTRGTIAARGATVIAVDESDWNGKAGNGLGSLHAVNSAAKRAAEVYKMNLMDQLKSGTASVAIYHTAGKGTRLAPVHLAENSNKPGVKLPSPLEGSMTILEAVIKQTSIYASSRKGRVSVFWGDQVFVPSATAVYVPNAHVDILATLGPMPSAEEWAANGLEKYGLIAVNDKGEAAQVEKVKYDEAQEFLASLGEITKVGTSLGSFSLSYPILEAMLGPEGFSTELAAKNGEMDSDPHFWMPLTLPLEGYISMMVEKKADMTVEEATKHWQRVQTMVGTATQEGDGLVLFSAVDVGGKGYWWDYGSLNVFLKNNLLLTKDGQEADALRGFMGVERWPEVGGWGLRDGQRWIYGR
jgi:hypothetical protein